MSLMIDSSDLFFLAFLVLMIGPALFALTVSALLLKILWCVLPREERAAGVFLTSLVGLGCSSIMIWYLLPTGEKVGPFPAILFGSAAVVASVLFTGLLLYGTAAWREGRFFASLLRLPRQPS